MRSLRSLDLSHTAALSGTHAAALKGHGSGGSSHGSGMLVVHLVSQMSQLTSLSLGGLHHHLTDAVFQHLKVVHSTHQETGRQAGRQAGREAGYAGRRGRVLREDVNSAQCRQAAQAEVVQVMPQSHCIRTQALPSRYLIAVVPANF